MMAFDRNSYRILSSGMTVCDDHPKGIRTYPIQATQLADSSRPESTPRHRTPLPTLSLPEAHPEPPVVFLVNGVCDLVPALLLELCLTFWIDALSTPPR